MSNWQRLEAALRKHGFLIGVLTTEDEAAIDALLKDIWAIIDPEQSA